MLSTVFAQPAIDAAAAGVSSCQWAGWLSWLSMTEKSFLILSFSRTPLDSELIFRFAFLNLYSIFELNFLFTFVRDACKLENVPTHRGQSTETVAIRGAAVATTC